MATPASGSEERGSAPISYLKAALTWQYNLIGLATAGLFALVSGNPTPAILAAGLELIYLSVVPNMPRFQRLARSWQYAEQKRRHRARLTLLYQQIPAEMRKRYVQLHEVVQGIRGNYERLSSTSQIFIGQMGDRLDALLHSYLRLLHAAWQHREYLRTTDISVIRREADELERVMGTSSPKVQEINRKRIEILKKRLEKFQKIEENCEVIDAQCAAIEDALGLVRDQSVTLRDPQQVSDQLESLVRDVEHTEETVREVEAIFDLAAPELTYSADSGESAPPRRNRIRN